MKNLTRQLAALGLGFTLAGAPVIAHAATNTPAAVTAPAQTPRRAEATQPSYAVREAANPHAAAFKGTGGAVYIGGSTVVVVLLIVLILVLL